MKVRRQGRNRDRRKEKSKLRGKEVGNKVIKLFVPQPSTVAHTLNHLVLCQSITGGKHNAIKATGNQNPGHAEFVSFHPTNPWRP